MAVDWSKCFILNGPLDTYVLLENGLLIYEGLQNKRDLGTRNIGGESSWSKHGNETHQILVRVSSGQEMVRKKSSRSGKSQGILF